MHGTLVSFRATDQLKRHELMPWSDCRNLITPGPAWSKSWIPTSNQIFFKLSLNAALDFPLFVPMYWRWPLSHGIILLSRRAHGGRIWQFEQSFHVYGLPGWIFTRAICHTPRHLVCEVTAQEHFIPDLERVFLHSSRIRPCTRGVTLM